MCRQRDTYLTVTTTDSRGKSYDTAREEEGRRRRDAVFPAASNSPSPQNWEGGGPLDNAWHGRRRAELLRAQRKGGDN